METAERRQYERLKKKREVHYREIAAVDDQGLMLQGTMLDCSGGGIRFETEQAHEKNRQLLLELEFDGWNTEGEEWIRTGMERDKGKIRVLGAVMWCQEISGRPGSFELGVRFTGSFT
jgi:hypothetical protein